MPEDTGGIDTTDTNIFLYTISIIAIAAGVALAIWSPFKQVGLFVITMFASIIILISVFATILKYMPWIILCCIVAAVGVGIIYMRRHHLTVLQNLNVVEKDMTDKAKQILGVATKKDT
jgi:hypothetical protein